MGSCHTPNGLHRHTNRLLMTQDQIEALYTEIRMLKELKHAVILAHYYARPEIQRIADHLGDSLALSQIAGETDADMIVFCGVSFMGETAKIISPDKKVLCPVLHAGCTLAEGATAEGINTWRVKNPDGLVVSYVNTTAAVKAVTDYCVTSANALKVVRALPTDRPILFGPDRNLGQYIMNVTGRQMDLWQGACYVHEEITPELVRVMLARYPNAEILIHPESTASSDQTIIDNPRCIIGSTTTIIKQPSISNLEQYVIATEPEVLAEMTRRYPGKELIPILPDHVCEYMKLITLEGLRDALLYEQYEVEVEENLRQKAWLSIERMLQF